MSVASELHKSHKERHAKFFPEPPSRLPPKLKLLPVVIDAPELWFVFPEPPPVPSGRKKRAAPLVAHHGPSLEAIKRAVCDRYGILRMDFLSIRRTREVSFARQVACYLAKTLTPLSLPQIGRAFGGRDHTTVLHSVRKIAHLRQDNAGLDQELRELEAKCCCVPVETTEGAQHETEAA